MSTLTHVQKKMLFLSSLGGAIEFYDFIIYIFLAPIIEKVFFASSSAYVATLKTLTIFSIGYLIRPIGGLLFSHFGDRYGRKIVFLLTVAGMALPTLAIGMLPTTAQVGIASPIALLLCRLLQGLALGGELPAAITFVSEHAEPGRRAFSLSMLFLGVNAGLLLGSLVMTVLTAMLDTTQMLSFGWRIPFLMGGIFGGISLYLRRFLHETTAFKSLQRQDVQAVPALTLLRHYPRQVIIGLLLVATGSVTVFLYLYWPQYLHQQMQYDLADLMQINTLGTLVLNVTILLGGLLADRLGYKRAYLLTLACLIVFAYPLFYLFSFQDVYWLVFSYMIFSIFFGFIPSAYSAILTTLFPTSIRYSGVALSYNLAYALFGGLSPVICTLAIHYFDTVLAPAYYVIGVAMLSVIACYFVVKDESVADNHILSKFVLAEQAK